MNDYEIYPKRNYHETVHWYHETVMDPYQMENYYSYEDIELLQDAINPVYSITAEEKEIYNKALLTLTIKQRLILDTYLATGNQKKTAKICGIGQSAVSLSMNGRPIYKDGEMIKTYGGIIHKIKTFIKNYPRDEDIRRRYKTETKKAIMDRYNISNRTLDRILEGEQK